MHSQKIKSLLRSINNLKKEVARTKFEQKENVRIQKNKRLEADLALMEVGINALRKLVNDKDACNTAIKDALDKGPKRIRIASREELKMDINKFKAISLRCIAELKNKGIKIPAFAATANLNDETGIREIKGKQDGEEEDLVPGVEDPTKNAGDDNFLAGDDSEPENETAAKYRLRYEEKMNK